MKTYLQPLFGQFLTTVALLALAASLAPRAAAAEAVRTGEQIFRQQCAMCHGARGEGTDDNYPEPLQGDRSVGQLARLIARTMPKDAPKKLAAEDAAKVAAYIYGAFYSKEAQARNKPPRIELSRLTVRQYRHAVADVVGAFRTAGKWDEQRGLKGEYFKSRRFGPGGPVLERLDPEVKFDFGAAAPAPDNFDPNQFSIRWQGSVLAPETGEYEFTVRTEHATRLWVNDRARPLIDAWVKSGNDSEHRASIYLLGGRVYPVRLEFSKAKQGVDDSKKNKVKPPEVKASVALLWKVPGRAAEIIPPRNLSPSQFPETLVVTTPFPPDDRSLGWERGTAVSKAWDQATTDAAIETAGYVAARFDELSGLRAKPREPGPASGNPADIRFDARHGPEPTPAERAKKLREFTAAFVERAFRRPLTDDQRHLYIDRQLQAAPDPEAAVKRVVLLALKSPRFLYREIGGGKDVYDVAARLSFGLWDSLPDAPLLEAAAKGQLATREQVARQAERMLGDLRTRAKLREFLLQWLKVDQPPDLAKDPARYPGFDQTVVSELRTSLELFLDDVVWGGSSDFRQLLLADTLFLDGRLAKFYGSDLPPDAPFQKVSPKTGERAGVLTHPYLLATFAYTATSSPIHRGVFLARNVLGQSLRPPPEAFTPLPAELHPELSTRERVALQTRPEACQSCHSMINPLGFTLEHYDAIGRYREKENGRLINATGAYQTRSGGLVKFAGVRDLATFLAGSEEVHAAFVEQLFQNLVKQPVRACGPHTLTDLQQSFARDGFSIRKLMVEIMATSALPAQEAKR
jgi:cytochrome c553